MSDAATASCPHCKATVKWNDAFPDRPFCSERCKLLDLGAWLAEEHRVPGDPSEAPAEVRPPDSQQLD